MMRIGSLICIAFIGLSIQPRFAEAFALFDANTSVRALGMGNAYFGVVKDADSLFYNPAGLARTTGYNWVIVDVKVGGSGEQILDTVEDIQDSDSFDETVRSLYGKSIWLGAGAKSAFSMPNFGIAVYDNLDASVLVENPVYPNLDINVINDFGYVLGASLPILPIFQMGIVLKHIQRTGSRVPFGASFVGSLDPDAITSNIEKKGTGYGMDLGANFVTPGPIEAVFSFVWKNVGVTKYKADDLLEGPPSDVDEMSVGAAVNIDLPLLSISPAIDIRYLNQPELQMGKKLNLGVEIGLPLLDIRAGFHQGYYTLGAGVNLGLLRFDAATYGVELGEYPGQIEDRRYVAQLTLEFGFDPGSSGGIFGGGLRGGSGGGGSRSVWGGKRLKQRR